MQTTVFTKVLVLGLALAPTFSMAQSYRDSSYRDRGYGHTVCRDVPVRHVQSRDDHRIAGTAIGAVAGGLLGHTVGHGSGRTLATVAGAAAGGYAGNRIQKNHQDQNSYTTYERRCWQE